MKLSEAYSSFSFLLKVCDLFQNYLTLRTEKPGISGKVFSHQILLDHFHGKYMLNIAV